MICYLVQKAATNAASCAPTRPLELILQPQHILPCTQPVSNSQTRAGPHLSKLHHSLLTPRLLPPTPPLITCWGIRTSASFRPFFPRKFNHPATPHDLLENLPPYFRSLFEPIPAKTYSQSAFRGRCERYCCSASLGNLSCNTLWALTALVNDFPGRHCPVFCWGEGIARVSHS